MSTPPRTERRPSATLAAADIEIKPAWASFLAASEVDATVSAYADLRRACGVHPAAFGRVAFDAVHQATQVSAAPHKTKSLTVLLEKNFKLRSEDHGTTRVVISGAGPVGLRAAVECGLQGMQVHVLERRAEFSRVNILMLWPCTADDLVACGARTFYSTFSQHNEILHLGTREIQLVFLKNALLLGVQFSYGTDLVAVQAPGPERACWSAWARAAGTTDTHQTSKGVLDFKPRKEGEYTQRVGQGRCNMALQSELDPSFALESGVERPEGVAAVPFDALILAEGEASQTCKRLGVCKSVDKFAQAIGLIINMKNDPDDPVTRPYRSFTVTPFKPQGRALKQAGVDFEFAEYLKGETHYVVVTIKKRSLLAHGALRHDLPGDAVLRRANLDEEALLALGRTVATALGLPAHTEWCEHHPCKLFDFSTRARCLAGFRVLGVRGGGAGAGRVQSGDLEAVECLAMAETGYHSRAVAEAQAAVEARAAEIREAAAAAATLAAALLAEQDPERRREVEISLELTRRAVLELEEKKRVGVAHFEAASANAAEWVGKMAAWGGATRLVPVFPAGDAMVEPFWPQGLGSNRGFHTALDAVWAVRHLRAEGQREGATAAQLQAALLEREFAFDCMTHSVWNATLLKPAAGWSADPVTRYCNSALLDVCRMYTDPRTKRNFKGQAAIPKRISALGLRSDRPGR